MDDCEGDIDEVHGDVGVWKKVGESWGSQGFMYVEVRRGLVADWRVVPCGTCSLPHTLVNWTSRNCHTSGETLYVSGKAPR